MTAEEMFKLCDGKDNWAKYYGEFYDMIKMFVYNNKLDHSEKTIDILTNLSNEIIDDISYSWYKQYLGK